MKIQNENKYNVQNLPQLCLQGYYIWTLDSESTEIAMSSMCFSIISIIVSILSMAMERSIQFDQNHEIITMDITGECVVKSKSATTKQKQLKRSLALLMNTNLNNIEILRPRVIRTGVAVTIHIYANDYNGDYIKYC